MLPEKTVHLNDTTKEKEKIIVKMKTHRQTYRTKIYSGKKRNDIYIVPKLFEICMSMLKKYASCIKECGVPYCILEPILKHVKPKVLFDIESHNLYLLEDTMELWKSHCNIEFPNKKRMTEKSETWREMYQRCCKEIEDKFDILTQKVRLSYRKSKLATSNIKLCHIKPINLIDEKFDYRIVYKPGSLGPKP